MERKLVEERARVCKDRVREREKVNKRKDVEVGKTRRGKGKE